MTSSRAEGTRTTSADSLPRPVDSSGQFHRYQTRCRFSGPLRKTTWLTAQTKGSTKSTSNTIQGEGGGDPHSATDQKRFATVPGPNKRRTNPVRRRFKARLYRGPRNLFAGSQVGSHSQWTAADGYGRLRTAIRSVPDGMDGCGLLRTPCVHLRIRRSEIVRARSTTVI